MGCKPKARKTTNNTPKKEPIDQYRLEEKGREQFFQHYSRSEYPIRHIKKKTEPHVEIGAENFLYSCIQPNIRGFCNNNEKYLFLCTTCKNPRLEEKGFYNNRFIIGYIQVNSKILFPRRLAVKGNLHLVPFTNELNYDVLGLPHTRPMHKFNEGTTAKVLKIIQGKERENPDYVNSYLEELFQQEEIARQTQQLPIDDECLGKNCPYREKCVRS